MKLKKILISFITIITCLFAGTVKAAVTAPESFIVKGEDSYVINTSDYLPNKGILNYNFHYKLNADGHNIFCVQSHHYAVTSGTEKYTFSKEMDVKFAYILANGYPNKNITGNKDKDYLITSFAVFYLVEPNDTIFVDFDLEKGTFKGTESDVVKEVAKLVNGANNYSYVSPTLNVKTNNNFSLSSDGKYYVSANNGVTITGVVGNYTVNLENAPSDTIITDVKGNIKNTFATSEKFMIKVPVYSVKELSNEFKVSVSATGSIYKAYLYISEKAKYQNTIALYPETNEVKNTAPVKLNLTTETQISKVDATTNKELAGAKLTVKDSNGKVIDTWTSTNEVHVIKNLKPGKYTLTEEIAPEGYILSTETVEFEVKLDGTVAKAVMKNEPTITEISKVDATTNKELAGAKLTVKDSNGKVIDTWTSTNEVHVIKNLKPGKYTLTEEIAPEGYILSTEIVEFEVKLDGTVAKAVMKNMPKEKIPVYISKQDITTSEELAGAHLEIKDEEGNLIEAWVSTNEPHMIEDLKPGKYFLTETLAPQGYELSTEIIEFIVKEGGTVDGDIIMYNKPETIVDVPSTSSFKTITSSLIGIIVIGLGSMIIYRNYKKNEEI